MKKLFAPVLMLAVLLFAAPVFAQTDVSTAPGSGNAAIPPRSVILTQAAARKEAVLTQAATRKDAVSSQTAQKRELRQETTLENLRTRALAEIDRRISSLNSLIARVAAMEKLSSSQKTSLTSQIQAEITSLTAHKVKIQAETDLEILKTDAKAVVASYRIYALFVPKIHILTAAEGMLSLAEKLTTTHTELKTRVDLVKAEGTDTSAMEESLAAMFVSINEVKTSATGAINTVLPLTPTGYPGNKTSLQSARESLRDSRDALMDARLKGLEVLRLLRQIPSSSTNSPTPTGI